MVQKSEAHIVCQAFPLAHKESADPHLYYLFLYYLFLYYLFLILVPRLVEPRCLALTALALSLVASISAFA